MLYKVKETSIQKFTSIHEQLELNSCQVLRTLENYSSCLRKNMQRTFLENFLSLIISGLENFFYYYLKTEETLLIQSDVAPGFL